MRGLRFDSNSDSSLTYHGIFKTAENGNETPHPRPHNLVSKKEKPRDLIRKPDAQDTGHSG